MAGRNKLKLAKIRIGVGRSERGKMGLKDDLKRKIEDWLSRERALTGHTAKTYVSCLNKLACKVSTEKHNSGTGVLVRDKAELKAFITTEWDAFSKELQLGSDRLQAAW